MMDHKEHGKRIAKNTLMLYVRMLFMMFLGLFTSRIVLEALGENDYGIYNVVGGVVIMFSVISSALNSAISRYITFEIGKEAGVTRLNSVYSTAVMIQLLISFIVVVLAEPIGLWFIENEMTIPADRISAAKIVLQFSLLSFVINLMSVPQMALITAHEQMSVYAYIGILDGLLRFGTALMVRGCSSDKLVLYSALMAGSVLIVRVAYLVYCRLSFSHCRFRFITDRSLLKEMFSFAGWGFIGTISGVLRDQGGNILVNIFSNPGVNAARAVAFQLNGAVQNFVTNFMTAVNPQITKSYASGDHGYMFSLLRKSSRMSFYLLFVISLPVLFNTEFVLQLWLKEVPEYTAVFVKLFIVLALCECISYPLVTAMLATGNIRNYQIVVGGLQLLNLPVSYALLKIGYPPEVTVVVAICISQICLAARLVMLRRMIGLSVREFLYRVYFNVLKVVVVGASVAALVVEGLKHDILSFLFCMILAGGACLFIGCTAQERGEIWSLLLKRVKHDQNIG